MSSDRDRQRSLGQVEWSMFCLHETSISRRFWDNVHVGPNLNDCWVWSGTFGRRDYGIISCGGHRGRRNMRAHRISWMLHHGAIPDGLWVLHKCDHPPCVNPDHLFLGDRRDNMLDCAAKGRIVTVGHSRKDACTYGHKFTPENTYIKLRGGAEHRGCRECRLRHYHTRKAKRQAIASAIRSSQEGERK